MRPAALLLAGLALAAGARADDPPKPEPAKVYDFTGRVEADTVELRPRVTGYVTKIAVKEGEAVKKGELLAEIDPRFYRIELDRARAKLTRAEAQMKPADAKLTRLKKAVAAGTAAKEELEAAEAEREIAAAEVVLAKAELELADLQLSWTKIAAPMDGRVSRIHTIEGNLVRADTDVVAVVIRPDPLVVAFDVEERTFARLREAAGKGGALAVSVGLATEDGFPRKAEFRTADAAVDPKTGTVRLRAALPNPKGELLPGQFVHVRVTPK